VDVFFVISGFIITLLLLRERERRGTVSVPGFYLRRVLRIVPAYLMFLVFVAVLGMSRVIELPAVSLLVAVTYTTSIFAMRTWELGHTWSLSVEEHSYLIWPVLVKFCGRWAAVPALVCVAAAPLARLAWQSVRLPELAAAPFASPCRMDSIAFGALLALAATSDRFRRFLPRSWRASAACAGLALAGLAANRYALLRHYPAA
jgi:peptidoglycan/LPS O-acetylase OafA/YrhL